MTGHFGTHYVNGQRTPAHGSEVLDVVNPATEQVIGSVVDGDADDVDTAVRAAAAGGLSWAAVPAVERAAILRRFADEFEAHLDEIAELVTRQNGTPIRLSRFITRGVPGYYRYFATLAENLAEEESLATPAGGVVLQRTPRGVVAAITPWNSPQVMLSWKVGPALAAGCAVVLKPSPETTLDAFLVAELATKAGVPDGVFNVVSGGRGTGAALVEHPLVRKVSFTGSTVAGRTIAEVCGRALKPVTLELGGKSAAILLDDVDLEAFVPFVAAACSPNTGQVCTSLTRILAPASRYDEVVEVVSSAMNAIPVGDPMDRANVFGPLVSERQRDRVESYLQLGVAEGAKVATGGGRMDGFSTGYYIAPTVFRDVTNDMRIAREEIFGPVLVVIPYRDLDEAVAIANDSEYGLSGGVFSRDHDLAGAIARRIETGTIGVNAVGVPVEAPFGGVKSSGLGRETGPRALEPYLDVKTIVG
ncbi:aldehyde dehydrogenase [Mycobacterium sp. C31M]